MKNERKELMSLFQELKLKCFQENFEEMMEQETHTEALLVKLCRMEVERKYDARVKRKIKLANFPKIKTLAMLDYSKTPKLPKQVVENLSTSKYIEQKRNIVLVGDSGGGKTHLAIALGLEACRKALSVRFYTACSLVNELLKKHKEENIEKFLTKLRKYDLLVIDELGYVPLTKKAAELLFQVFSDRYESGSLIVTSNLNFSRWTEVLQDKTMTTALLDRLTHNATIIKYDWGSIRFNETMENKTKKGECPKKAS